MKTETQKLVESIQGKLTESAGSLFICHCADLKYDIYAVGNTEEEVKERFIEAFNVYLKGCRYTVEEWLEDKNLDLADYDNDLYTCIDEYYGAHIFDISKGYALGNE